MLFECSRIFLLLMNKVFAMYLWEREIQRRKTVPRNLFGNWTVWFSFLTIYHLCKQWGIVNTAHFKYLSKDPEIYRLSRLFFNSRSLVYHFLFDALPFCKL